MLKQFGMFALLAVCLFVMGMSDCGNGNVNVNGNGNDDPLTSWERALVGDYRYTESRIAGSDVGLTGVLRLEEDRTSGLALLLISSDFGKKPVERSTWSATQYRITIGDSEDLLYSLDGTTLTIFSMSTPLGPRTVRWKRD